jgi:O-antigen ligase
MLFLSSAKLLGRNFRQTRKSSKKSFTKLDEKWYEYSALLLLTQYRNNINLSMSRLTIQSIILSNNSVASTGFLMSLILLILILPFDEGGNGYILQLITQMMLLLCGTLWAIQVIRRGQVVLIFDWIDLFVLGFVAWAAVSLYFSAYKYATILEIIKVLSYAALFYLCRMLFPLKEKQTILLVAIFGSGMFQFFVALYSLFIRNTPILQAGFVNPNNLACFFVIGANIALSFILFHRSSTSQHLNFLTSAFFLRLCVSVAMGCLLIAVLVLRSRGAVISFVGTGIFLTTLKKKKLGLVFLIIVGFVVFLPFPQGSILQRLRKSDDPFAYQRLDIWKSSLNMTSDHPMFGIGLGMYRYYGAAYNFPVEHQIARYAKSPNSAHNDILQIGAEVGLIGLVLFLGGLFRIGYYSLSQLRRTPASWHIAASSAGILGILIQGLFSNLLSSPVLAMTMVLFAVILVDSAGKYRQKIRTFSTHIKHVWQWYIALLLLFMYILIPVIGYPFLGHVYFLKYQQLRRARNVTKAVEHLQTALNIVPIHAYYHSILGNLYLSAFRNQPSLDAFYEGYKEFTQAIRYNPRESRFYEGLAELHREMFRQKLPTKPTAQNALREYQRAIHINPFDPFIRFSMATLYADIQEFDQAIAILREAVEIEPNFVGGYQMLSRMLNHLQREQEAQEAFKQADKILNQYKVRDQDSDYIKSLLRSIE